MFCKLKAIWAIDERVFLEYSFNIFYNLLQMIMENSIITYCSLGSLLFSMIYFIYTIDEFCNTFCSDSHFNDKQPYSFSLWQHHAADFT